MPATIRNITRSIAPPFRFPPDLLFEFKRFFVDMAFRQARFQGRGLYRVLPRHPRLEEPLDLSQNFACRHSLLLAPYDERYFPERFLLAENPLHIRYRAP